MMFTPKSKINEDVWNLSPGSNENPLWLLTEAELKLVPAQTPLHCIDGSIAIVGTDRIDNDTRKGYIAYGMLESELNEK
jgi:hypothetical protein